MISNSLNSYALTLMAFSFLVSFSSTAKEVLLSEQLEEELENVNFKTVDKLTKSKKVIQSHATREDYFSERKKPWSPIAFRALLTKGSRLIDIKTGKIYFNSSNIYVWAQEETVGGQDAFILNQERKVKYKVLTANLRSIELDLTLYPKKTPQQLSFKRQKYSTLDKELLVENHLTFHIESMNNSYFADLYGGTETVSTANRFQNKAYFNSFLPVDFGLSIGYQSGLWNEPDNQVKWSASYIGPSLRWTFIELEKASFNLKFGVEHSFNFKAIGANSKGHFSSLLYEFELEAVYYSSLGPILLGFSYRNMTWQLEDSEGLSGFADNKQVLASNSFFIGHRIDLDF